jgi:hypothetical protein
MLKHHNITPIPNKNTMNIIKSTIAAAVLFASLSPMRLSPSST